MLHAVRPVVRRRVSSCAPIASSSMHHLGDAVLDLGVVAPSTASARSTSSALTCSTRQLQHPLRQAVVDVAEADQRPGEDRRARRDRRRRARPGRRGRCSLSGTNAPSRTVSSLRVARMPMHVPRLLDRDAGACRAAGRRGRPSGSPDRSCPCRAGRGGSTPASGCRTTSGR